MNTSNQPDQATVEMVEGEILKAISGISSRYELLGMQTNTPFTKEKVISI